MKVTLKPEADRSLLYRLRFWLSNKLSGLSVLAHPETDRANANMRELFVKLNRDQFIHGTAIVRIDPAAMMKRGKPK